jgi:hypothetical protein
VQESWAINDAIRIILYEIYEILKHRYRSAAVAEDSFHGIVLQANLKGLWQDSKEDAFELLLSAAECSHSCLTKTLPPLHQLAEHVKTAGLYQESQRVESNKVCQHQCNIAMHLKGHENRCFGGMML